jgi:hypothetical protein
MSKYIINIKGSLPESKMVGVCSWPPTSI